VEVEDVAWIESCIDHGRPSSGYNVGSREPKVYLAWNFYKR